MMLSIEQPEVCREALHFPGGIHTVRLHSASTPRLIVKLPVSYLLPAKVKRGFKIYAIPVEVSGEATVGLMSAFFDDADSPLTSWRLLTDDKETLDLLHALTNREILVHMFDDQNRELLGYRAEVDMPLMAKIRLKHVKYPALVHESFGAAHVQANQWFSLRDARDDTEAISINFVAPLFPEDVAVSDLRPDLYQFHGARGYGLTSLERTEPGPYQELDIIVLLQRVFRPDQIYHAPKRHYDKEEIADVLVITDDLCLIVQAKDSPNTERTLNRTLKRKKLVSVHQVKEALKQVCGAVGYLRNTQPLRMFMGDLEISIDIGSRHVLSLVVVRELFIDTYTEYSEALFETFEETGHPCIALDYGELHDYTTFCPDQGTLLGAYFQVFDAARELGEFPRLRFGMNDVHALWRKGK
jgi:hypothetical protein